MLDLVPDCGSCAAVCCVATSFDRSEDFAFAKPSSVPCKHLTRAHRCSIHDELVARGMRGCAVYDCHGAGQRATRLHPHDEAKRNAAFLTLRIVHEWLVQLAALARMCPALAGEIEPFVAQLENTTDADLRVHRAHMHDLLRRARRFVVLA